MRVYTKVEKDLIIELHLQGNNDREISEALEINIGYVSHYTRRYWKNKMNNK
jgi:hypothetical protein